MRGATSTTPKPCACSASVIRSEWKPPVMSTARRSPEMRNFSMALAARVSARPAEREIVSLHRGQTQRLLRGQTQLEAGFHQRQLLDDGAQVPALRRGGQAHAKLLRQASQLPGNAGGFQAGAFLKIREVPGEVRITRQVDAV